MPIQLEEGETKRLDVQLTSVYAPPQPAILHGYIADAETGEGIAGASVELIGYVSATTDASGYFKIESIEPGEYLVRISHPDYNTMEV
jgi:protocatechuate 3,4-dioxygenase beta subunit